MYFNPEELIILATPGDINVSPVFFVVSARSVATEIPNTHLISMIAGLPTSVVEQIKQLRQL